MKNIITIIIVGIAFVACSKPKTEAITENTDYQSEIMKDSATNNSKSQISSSESSEMITKTGSEIATNTFSTKAIITDYLMLKNALAKDDSEATASAGKILFETVKKAEKNQLDAKKKSVYKDIAESMEENAEHIAAGKGSIEHQREHFEMLSKDINDLIDTFGSEQKLYKDFCPMYNDNKGAFWISEKKEIINPYQGSKMLTCGSVQKEW
ncbi:DUF3347 domain-containing protein [Chryseobacterium turcicum]|uniref:DUF3347 domain-containing protein n=1 Tax=Chryseobacterium turcicum TaxID=2898076 RepID=A0A9Q3V098_9FLAO|nr:DUF3347 domain-containing protein [Chryseobacterium turcicum]MCD1115388.1 DUF3347 domain-containing protein [Chryseobacterium turcicum]